MNPDVLLNRIRLEQRGLIDIHKKLYEMEHLLPVPDPMQFAKTAESAAILSEKSTAHLRNMFFSVSNEPPIYYYPKAAEVQGIRVWADTNYLRVLLPALLPDKKKRDGCKFLLLPLQAALIQSGPLPHFSDCVICVEHILIRCDVYPGLSRGSCTKPCTKCRKRDRIIHNMIKLKFAVYRSNVTMMNRDITIK